MRLGKSLWMLGLWAILIWLTLVAFGCSVVSTPSNEQEPVQPTTSGEDDSNVASGGVAVLVSTPQECGENDTQTDRAVSVVEDSNLKTEPNSAAPNVTYRLPSNKDGEPTPAVIDNSVAVKEVCRRGEWSRVRILTSNTLRPVGGWVKRSALGWVKTAPDGRRIYRVADFEWPTSSRGYEKLVVDTFNRVIADHKSCDALQLSTFNVNDGADGPLFMAICSGNGGDQNIEFTVAQARGGGMISPVAENASPDETSTPAPADISSGDAWLMCREPILAKLAHPSTADFDMWDTHVQQKSTSAMFTIGLTAKNAMGLELRLMGYCEIQAGRVNGAYVVERTD